MENEDLLFVLKSLNNYIELRKKPTIVNFDSVFDRTNLKNIIIPRSSTEFQLTISKLVDVSTFRNIDISKLQYKEIISNSIDETLLKLEENKDINLENIDRNEIEELKNDLYSINNTNNWQLKLMDYWEKWSKKNPIYNRIILIIYGLLIAIFTALIINIMDKNNSKSNVIYQTTVNNITIIGDVKYYYEVETADNEGNIIKGYVSKKKYNKLKSNKTVQK